MRKVLVILLSMVVFVAGWAEAPATESPTKPEAIVDTLLQSLSNEDVDTCLSLVADDVVFSQKQSGIKVDGKAQLEAIIRQHLSHGITSSQLSALLRLKMTR